MKKILTVAAAAMLAGSAGAAIVFQDNFNTSQGSAFTTSGAIGTSSWNVTRPGIDNDWGARIHNNILELSNDASAALNSNGWVFASQTLANSGHFNTTLANSAGLVTWTFNMRQIRPNPAGFIVNSYGVAFILGGTSANAATTGSGYAIVMGNSGVPDPIRFVSYTGGIQTLGTAASGLIVAPSPLNDPTNNFTSISITFEPTTSTWTLYGRDDGRSSFSDPASGTLTVLGSVVDSTFTGTSLTHMGAYWQGSVVTSQTAFFDNITLSAIPEPSTISLIGLVAGAVLLRRRRKA